MSAGARTSVAWPPAACDRGADDRAAPASPAAGIGEPDQPAAPVVEPARAGQLRGRSPRSRPGRGSAPPRCARRHRCAGRRGRRRRGRCARGPAESVPSMRVGAAAAGDERRDQRVEAIGDRIGEALDPEQRAGAAPVHRRPADARRRSARRASRARRTSAAIARASSRPWKTSVAERSGSGSTLKVTSVRKPSVPMRAGQQLHEIEAGDVLHHPAAGLDRPRRGR